MKNSGGSFDIDSRRHKIAELEKQTTAEGFWDDNQAAQALLKEINSHKQWVTRVDTLAGELSDLAELIELAGADASASDVDEIETQVAELTKALDDLEFTTQLSGPDDARDAILTIHPGA
ncbi:MAG TPA: PCRF domain-containing protein, partial [candidate division Zixibacteria bacterium]|nr:PCRF domain-containing protein [candidate division Zixibacteria bacterium]